MKKTSQSKIQKLKQMNENNNIDDFVKKVLAIKNEQEKTKLSYQDLSDIAQELGIDKETLENEVAQYQKRGIGFLEYQNYEDAIVALEHAYALNPEHPETLKMLTRAYFGAWVQEKNADYKEKALAKAEETLEQIPNYDEAFQIISVIKKDEQNKKTTSTLGKQARKVGDAIKVLWQEKIYNATILKIEGGQYKIKYDGFSDYWNEWITEKRIPSEAKQQEIKIKQAQTRMWVLVGVALIGIASVFVFYLGRKQSMPNYREAEPQYQSSPEKISTPKAGSSQTNYQIRDKVLVSWKGKYYNATILDKKDSQYKISYEGYGSNWDEWVGVERIKSR